MNPEEMRIEIAKACGWRIEVIEHFKLLKAPHHTDTGHCCGLQLSDEECFKEFFESDTDAIPDYLNDLNAMHEAEKVLNGHQQIEYASRLHQPFKGQRHYLHIDFDVLHTTASQRAEAFLKTIGKWKN